MIICMYCRQKWGPKFMNNQVIMMELHYKHVCPGVEYRNKKGVIK